MKKINKYSLVLLSLLVLGGCKGSNIEEENKDDDIENKEDEEKEPTFLDTLKQGLLVRSSLKEVNSSTGYTMNTTVECGMKDGETLEKKIGVSRNVIENFFKGSNKDDDNVYVRRLGINNKYKYSTYYAGNLGRNFSWENDGFVNPFALLSIDDFDENDGEYTLKTSKLSDTKLNASLCYLVYAGHGYNISSFKIKEDKIYASGAYVQPT